MLEYEFRFYRFRAVLCLEWLVDHWLQEKPLPRFILDLDSHIYCLQLSIFNRYAVNSSASSHCFCGPSDGSAS